MKAFLLFFAILTTHYTFAQWDGNNNTVNNVVSSIPDFFGPKLILSDHFGGAVIVFQNGNNIYAQRKTVGGQLNWGTLSNPLLVFASSASVSPVDLISDGQDGFYILFTETENSSTCNLYLKHIGANGEVGDNVKINPEGMLFCSDGKLCLSQTNVFVVWSTNNQSSGPYQSLNSNIYFQKYNRQGNILLDSAGQKISSQSGNRFSPVVSADSSGGFYIAFTDSRNSYVDNFGYIQNYDVYAQHFDKDGNKLWSETDIAINNTATTNQITYQDIAPPFNKKRKSSITSADGNWYIFYGQDTFSSFDNLILEAKKISFTGTELWSNAIEITPNTSSYNYLHLEPDNANGVIVNWRNTGANADIFVQRITNNGQLPWGVNGIKIPPAADQDFNMTGSHMTKTSDGNYIIVWRMDTVKANLSDNAYYIKAQKINDAGNKLWIPSGVYVCSNEDVAAHYPSIVSSIDSNTIVAWNDTRGITAALLKQDGTLKTISNISYSAIASGNWSDPSIWAGGLVPEPGAEVVVTQNITIDIPIICNSITVQTPAIVTIQSGATVTVFN